MCLLPVVVFSMIGVLALRGDEPTYRSTGVLSVTGQTLLAELTAVRSADGFGWETPGTVTARRINELLGTDEFASDVARRAGLDDELRVGAFELDDLRQTVGASGAGANLVRVAATAVVPEQAVRLVDATFSSFIDWSVSGDIGQSTAAEGFFADLERAYADDVAEARTALEEYLARNPEPADGERTPLEQAEIDRLTSALQLGQDRYAAAVAGVNDARLAAEQSLTDIAQRLRVVDQPRLPAAPESDLTDRVLAAGMWIVVGLALMAALVLGAALLDRSLRTPAEVERVLGLDHLGSVPEARAPRTGRRRIVRRRHAAAGDPLEPDDDPADDPVVVAELRAVLDRIRLHDPTGLPTRLAITSSVAGEGVTTVARGLAGVIAADLGRSVCLLHLDADLDADRDTDTGGDPPDGGTDTAVDGRVHVIGLGELDPERRASLLRSGGLEELADDLAARYDHLVIDTTPLLVTSDALAVVPLVDATVLVVRHGVTPERLAAASVDELSDVVCAGVILNRVVSRVPRRLRHLVGG